MDAYLEPIIIAAILFPFIAALINIPFILWQYHKYGAISPLKACVLYSFVLYFLCAYFLVILPLPEISEVAKMTGPVAQFVPFRFIYDIVQGADGISSFAEFIKSPLFYVPAFNILLTFPLGVYLKAYFKMKFGKVVLISFLVSLFFELTQVTGLYFIYPRGYRLFDVDDLMLNTLGGMLGWLVALPFSKLIPEREMLNTRARERGKKVSGLRRLTAALLDLFIYGIFASAVVLLVPDKYLALIPAGIGLILYYPVLSFVLGGSTLANKFLNLRIVDADGRNNLGRLIFRGFMFIVLYDALPALCASVILWLRDSGIVSRPALIIFSILLAGAVLIYELCVFFKFVFTSKPMLYEKLSGTSLISTISSGKSK